MIFGIRAFLTFLLIIGAGGVGLAIDRVRAETGVDKAVAVLGVSGEGVIVAVMDRGIDWESNDFRNDDGTTRIAYIFDLSDDAGADDPNNPYGRGTIYTRRQIDRALFGGPALATRDAVGHGTTTTGIPAGNGRNSADRKYRGIAPNATIIAVKVAGGAPAHGNQPAEPDWYVGLSGLHAAIDFVVDKARELSMPVVMLLNLGSVGGPTDGTSALSRKIDETVGPDHPGIVFVTGTGDDGIPSKTQNRAAGDVPKSGIVDLRFALDTGAGYLEVWYDRNQELAVSIDTPMGMLGPYPASQFMAIGTGVRVFHYRGGDDFYGSANGKRLLRIGFDGAAGAGEYILRLDHAGSSTGSSIHFDALLNTPFGESGRFLNFVTPGSIWDGATAFRNVAPNSYVIRTQWTDIDGVDRALIGEGEVGELWTGSSVGPTVDGRIGVDVSAPGDRIVAAYAPRSHWAASRWNLIEDGGGLYGMAGAVSAAAPVVTGIIALMLEVDPRLDAVSVKRILQETARKDEFTGQTPNPWWGYGKVDAFEALMAVTKPAVLDFPHFANGASITSEFVFVNVASGGVRPVLYFYDPKGERLPADAMVDVTGELMVQEDGGLTVKSELPPLGELTISTHGRSELLSGSARVVSEGLIGGVLRFAIPRVGVAGVGSSGPLRDAILPARSQVGGIRTGVAIRNIGKSALEVTCQLMKDGTILDDYEIPLAGNGQRALFIDEMFPQTKTSDFLGSLRCRAPDPGTFTGVALELDTGNRIFTTLPVIPLPR